MNKSKIKYDLYSHILNLLLTFGAIASPRVLLPQNEVIYLIKGKKTRFVSDSQMHLLVSYPCFHQKGVQSCVAIRKLKLASLKSIASRLVGGVNPGSLICQDLGGVYLMGLDSKSNQNGFCKFQDGSIVSNGSLHFNAMKNDIDQTK